MPDLPSFVAQSPDLATAHAAAEAAAQVSLPAFRADLTTVNKDRSGGFDPVTAADRMAEEVMRTTIAARCPEDAIIGEEHPPRAGRSGRAWVLDPIDGTRAFLAGAPSWGTLIALMDADRPILGVIDQPFTGERFIGTLDAETPAAWWQRGDAHRPLRTRARPLKEAILLSTFPEIGSPAERAAFTRVSAQVQLTRYGLDCYGYGLLALGQVDLVIEAGLNLYDIAAPAAVIRAAGGIVTDWQGRDDLSSGQIIAAGCRATHREALALLNQGEI